MTAGDAQGITERTTNIAMPEGCHIQNTNDYNVHSCGKYRTGAKER